MTDQILEWVRERARLAPAQQWTARFALRDTADGTAPDWSDFADPQVVTLRVALRTKPLRMGRRVYPEGQILSLMPMTVERKNGTLSSGWAEYGEDSYCGNGVFLSEEYRMQLLDRR
jgi:hypothetical protein